MIVCNQCGTANNENNIRCVNCNAELFKSLIPKKVEAKNKGESIAYDNSENLDNQSNNSSDIFCQKCGYRNMSTSQYCFNCGEKLLHSDSYSYPSNKSNKKMFIVILCVLLFIIAMIFGTINVVNRFIMNELNEPDFKHIEKDINIAYIHDNWWL